MRESATPIGVAVSVEVVDVLGEAMKDDELLGWLQDPRLGLGSHPGMKAYRQALEMAPDRHVRELLELVVTVQQASVPVEDDPFLGNLPPAETLPPVVRGRVPLLATYNGVVSIPAGVLCRNMLVLGPTGGGKTSYVRAILASLLDTDCTVVAFTRKSDLAQSVALNAATNPVLFLDWRQLRIAPLQVPDGADEASYLNVLVDFFAEVFHLIASRRLMRVQLHALLQKQGGIRWHEWIRAIEQLNTRGNIRLSQYQEASVYSMRDVELHLGKVIDCEKSDMVDKLTRYRGCVSICTAGLAPEMASMLACLMLHWAYETRGESDAGRPCLFLFDDALPLIHGGQTSESEGGVSPLSTWAFMGRSRELGIIAAAQNFSLVSPALRNNCETIVICGGSVGSDARELATHLHLTKEQMVKLTQMQPGQAVVWSRGTWPLPVFGRVPLIS